MIAVRRAVGQLVRDAERLQVLYADDDWAPLSDITLGLLLRRAGIRWRYAPLAGLAEVVWPPAFGLHLMLVERAQTAGEKRLAMRHGLAHVLAGHLDDYVRAGDRNWGSYEETVADLFALVDLIPNRMLAELRSAGFTKVERRRWAARELRRYAPRWPAVRIADRIRLRLGMEEP